MYGSLFVQICLAKQHVISMGRFKTRFILNHTCTCMFIAPTRLFILLFAEVPAEYVPHVTN